MNKKFEIYNTIEHKKVIFEPINPPFVGLYVCGPTVYSEPHLGHARGVITFDVLFRFLKYLGYKVRYVRNITDVGHLEDEVAGEGEDKIAKRAKLEKLEPMELVQYYLNLFRNAMSQLNVLPPSIEPHASGHIIEQQLMVKQIMDKGFAYEKNGSVYFDVEKYNKKYNYGKLSGRKTEELLSNTRELGGKDEKKSQLDFALWKKANPEHIMRWPSEWSEGFPGWHLECSAMGTKYLGETFDIHGGGMDLLFPHHECEIAQSVAANGKEHVKYWMHNNMITINGQKMARSLNNFITLNELFNGTHKSLAQAYSPMAIRLFILQAHYRSTLDFSNEALQASEKGLSRLLNAINSLEKIKPAGKSTVNFKDMMNKCEEAILDDLNTPIAISYLFDGVKLINQLVEEKERISESDLEKIKKFYNDFVFDILGLMNESNKTGDNNLISDVIKMILDLRQEAKQNKDYNTSDKIRVKLTDLGIKIMDRKDGSDFELP